ncbi:MAG: DUF4954 family protein [Treponemataceae bacterium]|nr:DUF4954 family protein [Treponemataceae bacterium]
MPSLTFLDKAKDDAAAVPPELLAGKRRLSPAEISVLADNLNSSSDPTWRNVYVDDSEFGFDPTLVQNSSFSGFVVLGRLCAAQLKYHDLTLRTGIYNSTLSNVATGDDNVIRNVSYLENYRLGSRVMLFNVQEMSCTNHSKFGNGVLKEGEPEENRISIAVGNENGRRAVLPFESMLPADAWLWSRCRGDAELMARFQQLTEACDSGRLDTFGTVGDDAIIKNTTLIKDAKIGACAYIKGAFKLKNVTILSSEDEVSQIGEGVELVNGIMGCGSRVFYQAVGVRFVIGRNCQLKYGARLINSILGDNSTVSCCELLNNLIFPFHEQHHNSSFLIATTILGQSNIAAGSTIGSNHNSRSPDGEILAGRGFWPGLCSDFKHNCRFASFVLTAKGSYHYELDIPYPFALVSPGKSPDAPIHIVPAWWFLYDMFAVVRNKYKFQQRDRRAVKVQKIEMNPFAPDTMQEIVFAMERLEALAAETLSPDADGTDGSALRAPRWDDADSEAERLPRARALLLDADADDFVLDDALCQRRYGALICKPAQAYRMYRLILKYFAADAIAGYCDAHGHQALTAEVVSKIRALRLFAEWQNLGGQIVPQKKVDALFDALKSGGISSWQGVHDFYDRCWTEYGDDKAAYAVWLLEYLYERPAPSFGSGVWAELLDDVMSFSGDMYASSVSSREKDFTNRFRRMTYRNSAEMEAVLGSVDGNDFLRTLRTDTEAFNRRLEALLGGISGRRNS